MGEYLGVLLLLHGPWLVAGATIITNSVILGRALSRRKASAAAIADRRATVADAAR